MPLKHLRVCVHCDKVRWAPCGVACRVPFEGDPKSWLDNLQHGAGEMLRGPVECCGNRAVTTG